MSHRDWLYLSPPPILPHTVLGHWLGVVPGGHDICTNMMMDAEGQLLRFQPTRLPITAEQGSLMATTVNKRIITTKVCGRHLFIHVFKQIFIQFLLHDRHYLVFHTLGNDQDLCAHRTYCTVQYIQSSED